MLEIVTYQPGDEIAFLCPEKDEDASAVTVTQLL